MVMKFDNEFRKLFFTTILAENKNIPWTPSRFPQNLLNAEKEKERFNLLFDKFVETFITDDNIEKFLENNSHLFNSTVFAILQQEYNKLKN
jgi:hypothetical protein